LVSSNFIYICCKEFYYCLQNVYKFYTPTFLVGCISANPTKVEYMHSNGFSRLACSEIPHSFNNLFYMQSSISAQTIVPHTCIYVSVNHYVNIVFLYSWSSCYEIKSYGYNVSVLFYRLINKLSMCKMKMRNVFSQKIVIL